MAALERANGPIEFFVDYAFQIVQDHCVGCMKLCPEDDPLYYILCGTFEVHSVSENRIWATPSTHVRLCDDCYGRHGETPGVPDVWRYAPNMRWKTGELFRVGREYSGLTR